MAVKGFEHAPLPRVLIDAVNYIVGMEIGLVQTETFSTGPSSCPLASQLRSSSRWPSTCIDLIDPTVIGILGASALAALSRYHPRGLEPGRDCARPAKDAAASL